MPTSHCFFTFLQMLSFALRLAACSLEESLARQVVSLQKFAVITVEHSLFQYVSIIFFYLLAA
jgi:hypothetical protein